MYTPIQTILTKYYSSVFLNGIAQSYFFLNACLFYESALSSKQMKIKFA